MMSLPTTANIFLCSHPTEMRKSFCGLSGIVRSELGREPNDGSLFLFINRRKDKLKALFWETDGVVLFYAGESRLPRATSQELIELLSQPDVDEIDTSR